MFAGLHQDNMFIRLSEKDREKVFATHEGAHHEGIRRITEIRVYPFGDFQYAPQSFPPICGFPASKNTKGKEKNS